MKRERYIGLIEYIASQEPDIFEREAGDSFIGHIGSGLLETLGFLFCFTPFIVLFSGMPLSIMFKSPIPVYICILCSIYLYWIFYNKPFYIEVQGLGRT